MERKSPFTLSASFDFPSDLQQGVYTPELIEELMYRLKRMGVSRLNWLYYGDVNVESDLGGLVLRAPLSEGLQKLFQNPWLK